MKLPYERSAKRLLRRSRITGALYERATARRQRRTSYSQFGEDSFLLGYYDRLRFDKNIEVGRGLVVDVGGYRPILYSNSYAFHRQGWRCINIDPDPTSIHTFDLVRPDDVNLCAAIGPEEGTADFFVFGSPSIWNTLDEPNARSVEQRLGRSAEVREVQVLTLDSVLANHSGSEPFELLLIDAEGYDEVILRTCDLERWSPRLVVVEAHGSSLEALSSSSLVGHMTSHDYQLVSWLNPNLVFARADSVVGSSTLTGGDHEVDL